MPEDDHMTPVAGDPRPGYRIRSTPGREVSCSACGRRFAGSGPIGCLDDAPVCDLCLFEADAELGMMLALVSVTRAYAALAEEGSGTWLEPLQELARFATVYERVAARSGPPRLFSIPGFTEEDEASTPAIPDTRRRRDE